MQIQRTIPLVVQTDEDLTTLVAEYNRFQQAISEIAYNDGRPMAAVPLHKAVYYAMPSTLQSQMKCSAIRSVAGAYSSAKRNRRPATKPFQFRKKSALFLFGKDFSFTREGKLSISTSVGRKKLDFRVPEYAREDFNNAVSRKAIVVTDKGRVTLCLTLEVPEPEYITPVGIDLGINNALVASTETDTLFISGSKLKQANKRTRKVSQRLQRKLTDHKAKRKDTHGVRRALKRLGRRRRNRTRTFCRETAATLCRWAPADAVLVFEALRFTQPRKTDRMRKGTRRKLSGFFYGQMTRACACRAQRDGIGVAYVDPYMTSQTCRICGCIGTRRGHRFSCACGHREHADVNASHNIRQSYAVPRGGGPPSAGPEALA